ncbi:MAG TPA: hypothetical protein VK335_10465 [Bryobacteraceae bacterium]|nr:hypothetical protein [Bryobacteraceae bacterium]
MFTGKKLIVSLALGVLAAYAGENKAVYVVTGAQQFGIVDLETGAFKAIGPGTPEIDADLVHGPNGTLYSLGTFTGSLVSIDPETGATTVIGPTGLGTNAFSLAEAGGRLYLTDFQNNLYSVNASTGNATLIGPTGMPPDPHVPFTFNADGTFNLCDEILSGVGDKLYATFDSFTLNTTTLAMDFLVAPNLWEINPRTGVATLISPTTANMDALVHLDGRFYAFRLQVTGFSSTVGPEGINQLVRFDLENGGTDFVRDIVPAAGPIFGVAPVHARPRLRWRAPD